MKKNIVKIKSCKELAHRMDHSKPNSDCLSNMYGYFEPRTICPCGLDQTDNILINDENFYGVY